MLKPLVLAALAAASSAALADAKGTLACGTAKVEAKSFGAVYVPAKKLLSLVFFREAVSDADMDPVLANKFKMLHFPDRAPKGPGGDKAGDFKATAKRSAILFQLEGTLSKDGTVGIGDMGYSFLIHRCDKIDRTVTYPMAERAAKMKAGVPAMTVELKPGGKAVVTIKGSQDADPKDKGSTKVTWDLQGSGTVRVYE